MKITLVDKKCPLSSQEQALVLKKLRLSLARFDDVISRLIVFIDDADGPRGVSGKTCRLVAGTRFGPPVIFTEWGSNTLDVVAQVAARLARAVGRATEMHFGRGWQEPAVPREATRS